MQCFGTDLGSWLGSKYVKVGRGRVLSEGSFDWVSFFFNGKMHVYQRDLRARTGGRLITGILRCGLTSILFFESARRMRKMNKIGALRVGHTQSIFKRYAGHQTFLWSNVIRSYEGVQMMGFAISGQYSLSYDYVLNNYNLNAGVKRMISEATSSTSKEPNNKLLRIMHVTG